jgi:YegS/Rv2252/BmrU family lipid kinase
MSLRILLIRNPASRAGLNQEFLFQEVVSFLTQLGHRVSVEVTSGRGAAIQLVEGRARDFDWVIAAGGDGTVREVVTGIVRGGHQTELGILPLGTGNDVARLMGLNSIDAFREAVRRGQSRPVDAIQVEPAASGSPERLQAGLLFAAVGFSGELLRQTTPRVVRWFGPKLCYSIGFLRALPVYRPAQVTVTCGDRRESGRLLLACAANAPHAGGGVMQLAPGASMSDGLLNMSIIQQLSPLSALRHFPNLVRGTHVRHPRVSYFEGRTMAVESDRPVPVAIDGDLVASTSARFSILPGRIRIVACPVPKALTSGN